MAKFKESELNEKLKGYEQESEIEIGFERSLEGKIRIENATVKYDYENGYINITSDEGNFKINTTSVYRYEEIKNSILIDLDTILIKIKQIS